GFLRPSLLCSGLRITSIVLTLITRFSGYSNSPTLLGGCSLKWKTSLKNENYYSRCRTSW
ncbi:MAG: hypothetical protein KAH84_03910, partial [Thiomargarita sp.]|nr:hypothetical protein [Thiomargarita sp.]